MNSISTMKQKYVASKILVEKSNDPLWRFVFLPLNRWEHSISAIGKHEYGDEIDGTVDFHATLFVLVGTSLSIKKPDGKRSYLYFVTSWCNLLKGEYVLRSQP